ncbi:hypothetical protein [Microcoleus sp. PH2017_27_LUM_O_A]|nr:hypothetical protein [Microcoleus sp. PH2017_27_LUM_O_A]
MSAPIRAPGDCPYTQFTTDEKMVAAIGAVIQRTSLIARQILRCAG